MEEWYDLSLNMKGIRKTAFVIGLGATVGVGVGKVINICLKRRLSTETGKPRSSVKTENNMGRQRRINQ